MIGTDAIIEYNSGAVTRMLRTVQLGGGVSSGLCFDIK